MLLSNSMMSKVTLVAYNELWECLPHRNTNTTDRGFDSRRGTSLAETPARLQGLAKTKSQLQRSKRNTSALMWSHTHGETLETCPSVLKKSPRSMGSLACKGTGEQMTCKMSRRPDVWGEGLGAREGTKKCPLHSYPWETLKRPPRDAQPESTLLYAWGAEPSFH